MIPSRSHEINGSRPSPLKVRKESHSIEKATSGNVVKHDHKPRQPVIIYAHSPKVIHTRAQDFMALVQRLTGLSRSDKKDNFPKRELQRKPNDESESSSVITEEANGFSKDSTTPFIPEKDLMNQRYLADIPLFTPSSMALFGLPNPILRHAEPSLFLSTDQANSVSPSVYKFIQEFP